jgi:peptide/nickel transport system substrate-binding protein
MASLPDPLLSRAVLVGSADYQTLPALPPVRHNLPALASALGASDVWGLPEHNCLVVENPQSVADLLDPVVEAAGQATDTLLFYYAGHGLVDPRRSELHLAVAGSDPQRMYTAVSYGHVRDALLDSRASRRIVILDCCYSGRALGQMGDSVAAVVNEVSAEGTYVLAAAAENKVALAPPGAQFTAFTGELLDIMTRGIPGKGPLLDLDSIYMHLHAAARGKGFPLPQKRDRNTAGQLGLIRNQAFIQQPALVIIDGDYLMASIQQPLPAGTSSVRRPEDNDPLPGMLGRLAAFGPIRIYITRAESREHKALLHAADQVNAKVTLLDRRGPKGPNIDVVMATAAMAELGRISRLLLVTGDSDFVPLVKQAERARIRVTVGCIPGTASRDLITSASAVLDLLETGVAPSPAPPPGRPAAAPSMGQAERRFHQAMVQIYETAKRELGYNATRFVQMVSHDGGLATARHLLWSDKPSEGFTTLWSHKRLDLTVEAHVLRDEFATLFTDDDRQRARDRLQLYGWDDP